MKPIEEFFSSKYNITPEEYLSYIHYGGGEKLFKEIHGQLVFDSRLYVMSEEKAKEFGEAYIKNKLIKEVDHDKKTISYKDVENDYIINSYSCRSNTDFDGSEEILFVGCSHTFGEGVPEEAVWGSQIANALGMSYANLAQPGKSAQWCVDAVLTYIKNKKARPKIIMALMPDFHRNISVVNPMVSISYQGGYNRKESKQKGIYLADQWSWDNYLSVPKYLERPFQAEHAESSETVLMHNLRAINYLEAYCEAAGIKFLWSTWAPHESKLFSDAKLAYTGVLESYVDVEACNWHATEEDDYRDVYHEKRDNFGHNWASYGSCVNSKKCSGIDCHSDLQEKYGDNFYIGTDSPSQRQHAHLGVHRHTHIAETFLSNLKEYHD